ncbi:MAG: hypothetical protein QNJ54_17065 [Prochloraceae cyanobacterium]|nr:hypothetical protein [Prochloraceae cyanobacterium]
MAQKNAACIRSLFETIDRQQVKLSLSESVIDLNQNVTIASAVKD